MTIPLIISTWSFSEPLIKEASSLLSSPLGALDAVEQCAMQAELDESIDSVGFGGMPDREGRVTLDAAIMLSPSQSGAVCAIERHKHPVSIARFVMEKTEHSLLAGPLADDFADSYNLPSEAILSEKAKAKWLKWKESNQPPVPVGPHDDGSGELFGSHDTIGTLAIDSSGSIAGSCSTSGMAWKVPGRVGDSPIIGHGLYVDPERGAATGTGHGELISGVCGSFLVVELMGRGASPQEAIHEALSRVATSWDLTPEHQVALVATTPKGEWSAGSLRSGFKYSIWSEEVAGIFDPEIVLHG